MLRRRVWRSIGLERDVAVGAYPLIDHECGRARICVSAARLISEIGLHERVLSACRRPVGVGQRTDLATYSPDDYLPPGYFEHFRFFGAGGRTAEGATALGLDFGLLALPLGWDEDEDAEGVARVGEAGVAGVARLGER